MDIGIGTAIVLAALIVVLSPILLPVVLLAIALCISAVGTVIYLAGLAIFAPFAYLHGLIKGWRGKY